jgi:hypothetical protein
MHHRLFTLAFLAAVSLTACEILPLGSPDRFSAAEHDAPPPPPAPDVCWIEGPNCTGICTPCPEI